MAAECIDECEDCINCDDSLDWDLYCETCKKQYTREEIEAYYAKLVEEAYVFYTNLEEKEM
jgi:hypothetical protein